MIETISETKNDRLQTRDNSPPEGCHQHLENKQEILGSGGLVGVAVGPARYKHMKMREKHIYKCVYMYIHLPGEVGIQSREEVRPVCGLGNICRVCIYISIDLYIFTFYMNVYTYILILYMYTYTSVYIYRSWVNPLVGPLVGPVVGPLVGPLVG